MCQEIYKITFQKIKNTNIRVIVFSLNKSAYGKKSPQFMFSLLQETGKEWPAGGYTWSKTNKQKHEVQH